MRYVFADCILDTRLYELRYAGQLLNLEPKVFNMLVYVIRHRERVVTKQELLDFLWPEQFISDATFDHCLMAARRTVGDDGRRQEVIKTIRGRGYRFVASLQECSARLPHDTERLYLRLDLHLRLSLSLLALGRDREVLERLQQQQGDLDRAQDASLTGRYALLRSQTCSNLGEWQHAARQAQTAIVEATSCRDHLTLGQAYHALAMERYWTGHPQQGVEYAQQALGVLQGSGEA